MTEVSIDEAVAPSLFNIAQRRCASARRPSVARDDSLFQQFALGGQPILLRVSLSGFPAAELHIGASGDLVCRVCSNRTRPQCLTPQRWLLIPVVVHMHVSIEASRGPRDDFEK